MAYDNKTLQERFNAFAEKARGEGYEEFRPILEVGFLYGAMNMMERYNEKCIAAGAKPRPEQIAVMLSLKKEIRELETSVFGSIEGAKKRNREAKV